MADSSAAWLHRWPESLSDHDARHDPQPYEQLAAALEAAGETQEVKAIRFEKLEHKRQAGNGGDRERARLWVSRWVVGHGEYPFLMLGWFAMLVGVGWGVAGFSAAPALRRSATLGLVATGFALATILVGALTLLGG